MSPFGATELKSSGEIRPAPSLLNNGKFNAYYRNVKYYLF